VGLGSYAAPLGDQPEHSAGGAIGYQMFLGTRRREQLVFEIGGRAQTETPKYLRQEPAEGVGVQYQQAITQRFILIVGGFAVNRADEGMSYGGRMEWVTKF
jgi:hypothetical protein